MIRRPILERFLEKVEKTATCWFWKSVTLPNGYGRFWNGRKQVYAHRFSYNLYRGQIQDGLQIDHLCRVRNCVNPQHLEVVTGHVNTLRGIAFSARHAQQTHCIHGHEFTATNTYIRPNRAHANRYCRECGKLHKRRKTIEHRGLCLN